MDVINRTNSICSCPCSSKAFLHKKQVGENVIEVDVDENLLLQLENLNLKNEVVKLCENEVSNSSHNNMQDKVKMKVPPLSISDSKSIKIEVDIDTELLKEEISDFHEPMPEKLTNNFLQINIVEGLENLSLSSKESISKDFSSPDSSDDSVSSKSDLNDLRERGPERRIRTIRKKYNPTLRENNLLEHQDQFDQQKLRRLAGCIIEQRNVSSTQASSNLPSNDLLNVNLDSNFVEFCSNIHWDDQSLISTPESNRINDLYPNVSHENTHSERNISKFDVFSDKNFETSSYTKVLSTQTNSNISNNDLTNVDFDSNFFNCYSKVHYDNQHPINSPESGYASSPSSQINCLSPMYDVCNENTLAESNILTETNISNVDLLSSIHFEIPSCENIVPSANCEMLFPGESAQILDDLSTTYEILEPEECKSNIDAILLPNLDENLLGIESVNTASPSPNEEDDIIKNVAVEEIKRQLKMSSNDFLLNEWKEDCLSHVNDPTLVLLNKKSPTDVIDSPASPATVFVINNVICKSASLSDINYSKGTSCKTQEIKIKPLSTEAQKSLAENIDLYLKTVCMKNIWLHLQKDSQRKVIYVTDDEEQLTNLHIAVQNSKMEEILCLIEIHKKYHVDNPISAINMRDKMGKTALDYAVEKNMPLVVSYLKENGACRGISL